MANSSGLFSSDDEEPLMIMKEKDLRKKLQQLLQGVPPPSSITISTLSAEEILSKYKENEPLFGVSNLEKSNNDLGWKKVDDFISFKNNSDVSEDIAGLLQKIQERYVQVETMSSCNIWFQQSIPLTGSAKKRCRARQRVGLSPGRRLSHLARRKQIFSCANLQRMANLEKKKHLEIKKSGIYQDKVKATERRVQYEKLNTSKRALFMSPDDEFPNNSKLVKEFPKRKLFSSSEKKKKLPLQENSKRSEVKRWLFHQNFTNEVSRKRLRDDVNDQLPERKKKCPRRSLTFTEEDESSKSPASSSTRSSHSLPPLSETHKNKLLWAVSVALKEADISRKDGQFKTCASSLFMTLRKNLNNILNSYSETSSTSEKMLFFARESIPKLLEKLGLPGKNRSVLAPVKNQKNENRLKMTEGGKENCGGTNETHQGDFDVVFKTPKKFIRVKKKSKTCDKAKGRSYFKGVLVRCKSLESLNTSGEGEKGSVAKKLFSQIDISCNFDRDETLNDTLNNCDDSFSLDNTNLEMNFLNDSDVNLASQSLAPSSVSEDVDGNSSLLAALKRKDTGDVKIVEESDGSNESEESSEIRNQDFKEVSIEERMKAICSPERIEESEEEEKREEVLETPVVVEESADEEEKETKGNEVLNSSPVVGESADEEEKEIRENEVLNGSAVVAESDNENEVEEGNVEGVDKDNGLDVVEESEDEEALKEQSEALSAVMVNESGNEKEEEVHEVEVFSEEVSENEDEKEVAVSEELIKMEISESGKEDEYEVENMEIENEPEVVEKVEKVEEVVEKLEELEKGEVVDVKEEIDDEEQSFKEIKEELLSSDDCDDSQNNSMLPPQTSTPILSPVLRKSKKNRKLMVKKTKKNWKIVRDQSEEDSVNLENLKLKVRLSHEWEVIPVNSSASELESSCNMNQSSLISLYNKSNPETDNDNLEESSLRVSDENATGTDEENLSAMRLKELLEEKNFVEIEPKLMGIEEQYTEAAEEVESLRDDSPPSKRIESNEERITNCSPPSTVDHQALQEILRSENKYLKPDESTPAKRANSPVLTNSDQKKRVLSLENYKARKQQEVANDLDGISPLKSDDGLNRDNNDSSLEAPRKKIYHIRLKSSGSHKRRHKSRRENRLTPVKNGWHLRREPSFGYERSVEKPEVNARSAEISKKNRQFSQSSSEFKSVEIDEEAKMVDSNSEWTEVVKEVEMKNTTPEKEIEDNIRGVITMQAMFKALFDISNVIDQQIKHNEENPGSINEEEINKTLKAAAQINDAINKGLEEMQKEASSSSATKSWLDLLSNFHANNPLLKNGDEGKAKEGDTKISPKDPRVKNNEPSFSKNVTGKNVQKKDLYRPYLDINEHTPSKSVSFVVQPPSVVQESKNFRVNSEETPPRPIGLVGQPPPLVQNDSAQVHEKRTPTMGSPFVPERPFLRQSNSVQVPSEQTPPRRIDFVNQPPPLVQNSSAQVYEKRTPSIGSPVVAERPFLMQSNRVQVPNEQTPPRQIDFVRQPPPLLQNGSSKVHENRRPTLASPFVAERPFLIENNSVQVPNEQTPPRRIDFVSQPPPSVFHMQTRDKHTPTRPSPSYVQPQHLIQKSNVRIPNEFTPPKPRPFVPQSPSVGAQPPNERTPPRQILHVPHNTSNNLYKQAVERNNQNWHARNPRTRSSSPVLEKPSRSYHQSETLRRPLLEGSPGFSNYNYHPQTSCSTSTQAPRKTPEISEYWIQNREKLPSTGKSRLEGTRGFSNYNYPQNIPQNSQRPQTNYPHYSETANRGIPTQRVEEFCSPERNTSRYYNQSYHTPDNYMYNNHSVSPSPNGMYNSYSAWQSPQVANNVRWNGYQESPVAKSFRRSMVSQMQEASYYGNC